MDEAGFLNLAAATALVVDDHEQSLEILVSVLTSFGTRQVMRAESAVAALDILERQPVDLILSDGQMPGTDGYEFVRKVRRSNNRQIQLIPIIIVTAHTRQSDVVRARDCGANFIIAKPITPRVVLERIQWVGRGDRLFIECDSYVGPDRRYKNLGPPPDFPEGRRRGDVPLELGVPEGQNMSLDEINMMVKPQRVIS